MTFSTIRYNQVQNLGIFDWINVILESDVERTQEEPQRHQSDQPVNVLPKKGATSLVTNHTNDLKHFSHITINDQGGEINKVVEMPAKKTVDVGDMIVIDEPERQNAATVQDLAFWECRGYKVRLSKMLTCTLLRTTASLAILAENPRARAGSAEFCCWFLRWLQRLQQRSGTVRTLRLLHQWIRV